MLTWSGRVGKTKSINQRSVLLAPDALACRQDRQAQVAARPGRKYRQAGQAKGHKGENHYVFFGFYFVLLRDLCVTMFFPVKTEDPERFDRVEGMPRKKQP